MGVATLTEKQRLAMEALKGARGEGARGHTGLRSGIARSRNGNNVLYLLALPSRLCASTLGASALS